MVLVNGTAISGTQTISIGVNVTIECVLTDTTSTSTVQWTLDGTPLTEGITTSSNVDSSELSISPFMQCGEYSCAVTNTDGQSTSASVQLFGDVESKHLCVCL